MRLLAPLLASVLLASIPAPAASITADELAQHLGVSVWRIPQAKLPKYFSVFLELVRNGKTEGLPDGGSSGFEFPTPGDLVVCAHEANGKMVVTLACGGAVMRPYVSGGLNIGPFQVTHEIALQPAVGAHLLCADYPIVKDAKNPLGRSIATGKIKDATSGLVLVVTELP